MILFASSVALCLASSMMMAALCSASAMRAAASLRFFANSTSTCLCALVSSIWACSAAFKPWAIFSARSSKAVAMGGHTNFIVNHTKMAKTMA